MSIDKTSFWKENNSNLNNLTLEDAKFIFGQAEKRFLDTIETAKRIYERNYTLLTIISGFLLSLTAYSINRWEIKRSFDNLEVTAISGICYFLCLGLFFVLKNISPQDYDLPGTVPENYFGRGLFNEKLKNEDRLLKLYIVELINYNQRIENNEKTNNLRWTLYSICLKLIFYSPIILSSIFLFCSLISPAN